MSLLFDINLPLEVVFSLKSNPDEKGEDMVLVSKDIWTRFQQPGSDRIALSIRPIQTRYSRKGRHDALKSLVCWAALDEEVRLFTELIS